MRESNSLSLLAAPFFALFLKERCRRVHGRSANPANHFFFFLERKRKSSCTKRKRTFAALKKKEKLNKNLSVKKESEENPIKTLAMERKKKNINHPSCFNSERLLLNNCAFFHINTLTINKGVIGMAVRHLIDFKDWKSKEIEELLDIALKIKKNKEKYYDVLKNKTLTMIFQKTSTRTRLSFEAGMTQLGGHAIFLDWKTTQFIMADIQDEAKCVNRYSDVIMARLLRNADLMKIAEVSTVPVINGLCEKYHPCQVLADILTVKENKGNLKGLKLVYYGIANNVSNSLSVIATKLGMNFVLSAPERHAISLDEELLKQVNATGLYSEEKDPLKAVKDADIVYTDTWVDMELFLDPKFEEEKKRRMKTFMPYQVNKELLKGVPDALIMHDLPAHRGYEIDDFAMKSSNSIIFDQAENRLHAQKAILLKLLGKA